MGPVKAWHSRPTGRNSPACLLWETLWRNRREALDVAHRRELTTIQGQTYSIASSNLAGVAFIPDDKRLATADWGNLVRICDPRGGREALALKGHSGYVHCVAFSPDGRRIASGSDDHTIRIWDARSGQWDD